MSDVVGPYRILVVLGEEESSTTYVARPSEFTTATTEAGEACVLKLLKEPCPADEGGICAMEEERARWCTASGALPRQARLIRLVEEREMEDDGDEEEDQSPPDFDDDDDDKGGEVRSHLRHRRRHHHHDRRCYLATVPYCSGGILQEVIKTERSYDLPTALRWVMEVAQTLYHLHTTPGVRLYHGSVSLSNVLLREEGGEWVAYLRGPGSSCRGMAMKGRRHHHHHHRQNHRKGSRSPEWTERRPCEGDDVSGWGMLMWSLLSRSEGGSPPSFSFSSSSPPPPPLQSLWEADWQARWAPKQGDDGEEGGEGDVPFGAMADLVSLCLSDSEEERPSMRAVLCRLAPIMEAVQQQRGRGGARGQQQEGGLWSMLVGAITSSMGRGGGGSAGGRPSRSVILDSVLVRPEVEVQVAELEEKVRAMTTTTSSSSSLAGRVVVVDREVLATLLWNKAMAHKKLQEVEEAQACLTSALEGLDRVSPIAVYCMSEMAALCKACGESDRALSLYEEALRLGRKALPSGHPDLARFLHNQSMVHFNRGEHEQALTLLEEALDLKRKSLPPGDPDIATSIANIAMVQEAKGDQFRALQMCQVALRLRREALPPNHPHILSSLDNLAFLYKAGGQYTKALPLCEEALQIRREVLDPLHPDLARSLSNVAALYEAKNKNDRALPLLEEALRLRRQALPKGHPDIATSLSNLGGRYRAKGDLDRALELYEEALEIRRRALPAGHPDLLSSLNVMVTLHRARGEHERAAMYDEEASCREPPALTGGYVSPFGSNNGSSTISFVSTSGSFCSNTTSTTATTTSSSSSTGAMLSSSPFLTSAASVLAYEMLSGLGTKMERSSREDEQELSLSPPIATSPPPPSFLPLQRRGSCSPRHQQP